MTLEQLRDQLRVFAAARGWQAYHSPKNLSMALRRFKGAKVRQGSSVPKSKQEEESFLTINK